MNKMALEEYKGVFIYAQQVDNEISSIAFELIGKAKELAADLGTDVTAVLLGHNVGNLVDSLAEYGADKVIVVDDPELETYRTEPYAHALASVINEYKPEIMLVGATAIGRDLGPTVSARVKTGLTADCTMLEIGDFPLSVPEGKGQAVRRGADAGDGLSAYLSAAGNGAFPDRRVLYPQQAGDHQRPDLHDILLGGACGGVRQVRHSLGKGRAEGHRL